MSLSKYIHANKGNGARLALELGISASYLSQMATGYRPVKPAFCPMIESLTGGLVRCEDLRPDIDWSVLRRPNENEKTA